MASLRDFEPNRVGACRALHSAQKLVDRAALKWFCHMVPAPLSSDRVLLVEHIGCFRMPEGGSCQFDRCCLTGFLNLHQCRMIMCSSLCACVLVMVREPWECALSNQAEKEVQ
jgi:hypothetical protein